MINHAVKKIHRYRVAFLILISVLFLVYLGLNPVDVGKYFGARFGSAVGMSVGVPENPMNKLAMELKSKEDGLAARERDLADREAALASAPMRDRYTVFSLFGGIFFLFVLILINFVLDRRYRRAKQG